MKVGLFDFGHAIGLLTQELAEALHVGILGEGSGHDRVAHGDVDLRIPHLEEFAGEAHGAQAPVDEPEDVEEGGVVSVEVDGNHGHLQLLDQADYGGLPFAVGDM